MAKMMSFCAHKKIIPATQWEPEEIYCDLGYDSCDDCEFSYSYEDYCDSLEEGY